MSIRTTDLTRSLACAIGVNYDTVAGAVVMYWDRCVTGTDRDNYDSGGK